MSAARWTRVCAIDDIIPDCGACALVGGRQVALFRIRDAVHAIGNFDPGVQINAQENSDGTAQTMMVFSREGATTNGPIPVQQAANLESKDSNAKKSMELVVAWAKDTWGIWRLDGKQTLDNAKRRE